MNAPASTGSAANPALTALYLREMRAEILRAWRTPAYIVPTLALPVGFYALFGIALAQPGSGAAARTLATFGVSAALGPALFGFGAGIAADRDAGILALKQVSPLPVGALLAARLVTALVFALVVLVMLYALAATAGGVELPRQAWAALALVHLTSVVPFCLLGLSVGLRAGASTAIAVTNLMFFGLAVLGGLWIPLFVFPDWLQKLAWWLPSRHLGELALVAARVQPGAGIGTQGAFVGGFALACIAAVCLGWRRGLR